MLNRISKGDQISLGGAVVLFISLFLTWYSVEVSVSGFSAGVDGNAFDVFKFTDLLLLVISLGTIAMIFMLENGKIPSEYSWIPLAAGAVAALFILFRMINKPGPGIEGVGVDYGLGFGIFVGLIGAAGIIAGQVMKGKQA